ncbi:hypothetical protein BJX61DRAFT_531811 [Aspergillus egyptiacus]|nr:hypothetical protein BJX61DRAFT_531811 [Aspergillus egyptiacus]
MTEAPLYMKLYLHTTNQKSPPAANKFRVGAVLVNAPCGQFISTGYSLEYPHDYKGDPGSTTHAEQCCFIKVSYQYSIPEERIHEVLPAITALAIKTVYVGIKEPGTFIAQNNGQARLEAAGVEAVFPVEHWITQTSLAGHAT